MWRSGNACAQAWRCLWRPWGDRAARFMERCGAWPRCTRHPTPTRPMSHNTNRFRLETGWVQEAGGSETDEDGWRWMSCRKRSRAGSRWHCGTARSVRASRERGPYVPENALSRVAVLDALQVFVAAGRDLPGHEFGMTAEGVINHEDAAHDGAPFQRRIHLTSSLCGAANNPLERAQCRRTWLRGRLSRHGMTSAVWVLAGTGWLALDVNFQQAVHPTRIWEAVVTRPPAT
ncbi:hypothetical protein BSY239_1856 [Hydrogenophaga sp. RAC07]|nr:hypothetical protein BSY239_1856 [Hydrogenophaga sp. RAC07]